MLTTNHIQSTLASLHLPRLYHAPAYHATGHNAKKSLAPTQVPSEQKVPQLTSTLAGPCTVAARNRFCLSGVWLGPLNKCGHIRLLSKRNPGNNSCAGREQQMSLNPSFPC